MNKIIIISFLIIFAALSASAEPVSIYCNDLYEIPTVNLKAGEKAELTVYLTSIGDAVDGFIVQLEKIVKPKSELLAEVATDSAGVVKFSGLTPASYRVAIRESGKPMKTVQIGDMRLKREAP